ncbi:MAG TPA: class I adenylate-forming enzyme family protein [Allosphingosinicella sp.]|nr:class I adenylate-forming enzyme family protein [Allosphingosinicella sp.]
MSFGPVHRYLGSPPEAAGLATLFERLADLAAAQPDAPWLIAPDRLGAAETLAFAEAERRSAGIAAWAAEQGLDRGTRVALAPRNDIDSAVALLGLMRAGLPTLVINPQEPPARLAEILGDMPCAAVIAPSAAAAGAATNLTLPAPDELPPRRADLDEPRPGDVSLLFGTSGSTAASKIVRQSHLALSANAEALRRHHGLAPGRRMLGCLPVHHVNGCHFTLMATLWAGATAILLERFEAAPFHDAVRTWRPALASVVPTILEALVADGARLPHDFGYFVSAAAPLSARTASRVLDRLGARVLQGFGLTETSNFSTTMPLGLDERSYRRLTCDADIPSIGGALYGNEVRTLRADGGPCDDGEIGEICMRGFNVMLDYADNPEATAAAFAYDWFHSGDMGCVRRDPDGRAYLFITGRAKNIAKVMGLPVSLEEMERALLRLPGIADAACCAIPDAVMGEAVVALVAAPAGLDRKAVEAHLSDYFSPLVLPRRYLPVAAVPRTPTGKVIRGDVAAIARAS